MRLPSLDQLVRSAAATARRFPVVLAAAVLTAVVAQLYIDHTGDDVLERLLYVSTLGLPLFFSLTVLGERRGWGPGRRAGAHLAAAGLLAAIFLALPGWSGAVAGRRYFQLSGGFHLAVAFLPFLGTGEARGFWEYNKSIFLRFLTALLYSVVLYAGLSVALLAVEHLFGVDLPGATYSRLWAAIAFLFHPWFFLAGVPRRWKALDRRTEYPRGLEIFVQYVLVPLVIVYLAILTVYAGRVLIAWEWPSGWIGWLVSGVAAVGILALLLVHPVRDRAEHAWVRLYGRWFWPALVPAVALVLLAVGQRIGQYGLTEDRYFLLVLSVWLAGTTLHRALVRSDRIRLIPQTLCAVLLLTTVGPWSAYSVSRRSQTDRLADLLRENGMLAESRLQPAGGTVSAEHRREISAIFRYLVRVHGTEPVEGWFGAGVPAPEGEAVPGPDGGAAGGTLHPDARFSARQAVTALGLDYAERGTAFDYEQFFRMSSRRGSEPRPIDGYSWLVGDVDLGGADTVRVDGRTLVIRADTAEVRLSGDDGTLLRLPLGGAVERALAEHGDGPVPPDALWIAGEGETLRAALWLERITGRRDPDGALTPRSWEGDVFLGPASPPGRDPDNE